MVKRIFFILILGLVSSSVFSQKSTGNSLKKDTTNLIQMTGIVISDSMQRLPFTRVIDLTTNRGVVADYYGYFALVVHPGDTLLFSQLGFKKKKYVVPDSSKHQSISLVQILKFDTIMSEPVDVYPWPSKEAFAEEFVNMESPNSDLKRARKRLTPQEMAFVGELMKSDGLSSYSSYQREFYQEQYTRGQGPANNLLNPAAWSEFIKGIGTGRYQISN